HPKECEGGMIVCRVERARVPKPGAPFDARGRVSVFWSGRATSYPALVSWMARLCALADMRDELPRAGLQRQHTCAEPKHRAGLQRPRKQRRISLEPCHPEIPDRVAVADVLDHLLELGLIGWILPIFDPGPKEIAENPPEILVSGKTHETPGVGQHADELG